MNGQEKSSDFRKTLKAAKLFENHLRSSTVLLLGLFNAFVEKSKLDMHVPLGQIAITELPEWTQKVITKVNNTLLYRLHFAFKSARETKSPYAIGYLIGLARRIFRFIYRDFPKDKGVFWSELFSFKKDPKPTRQEERMVTLAIALGLLRIRRNPTGMIEIVVKEIYLRLLLSESWTFFQPNKPPEAPFENLLKESYNAAVSGDVYDSKQIERFNEGVNEGYKCFLNGNGWFTVDGGRGRIYLTLLSHWKAIECLRTSFPTPTYEELFDAMEDMYGHPIGSKGDPIKAFKACCKEIGLKLGKGGRPKKTTKRKKSWLVVYQSSLG